MTIDLNPVTTMLSHVDFLVVKKGEAVHAEVELRFINESPVEKSKTGRVNELLSTVDVFADPIKLPKYIDVDMSQLETMFMMYCLSKILQLPAWVKVENDADQAVVTVVALGDENEGAGDSEMLLVLLQLQKKLLHNRKQLLFYYLLSYYNG
jgi:hypothetical protein